MGLCMGKESTTGLTSDLPPEGRFIPQPPGGNNNESTRTELRAPVIFVLGGPGSGKITHCDRVVQERPGLAHINMTDLIQQHLVGNSGLDDFSGIPASNLVEVLQMEMKMAVNSKGFLVSGYPRSMRDVVEYQKKLTRVDGVILLNWHIRILEKQIEYGSHLGDTVLQLARMELKNYSKNVLSVAEYFDQMKKLVVVDGERQPSEVYADFLNQVDSICGAELGGPTNLTNGIIADKNQLKFIWVVGGPGSNKSLLSQSSVKLHHSSNYDWLSISMGLKELSKIDKSLEKVINRGELPNEKVVMEIINDFVKKSRKRRFVLDGFPRSLAQIEAFKIKYPSQNPPCILVDCSESELSRTLSQRPLRDDSSVIKRRLDLYRTVTLPTLKVLDDLKRLHIIDGDVGDKGQIVEEFNETIGSLIEGLEVNGLAVPKTEARKPSTDTINKMYNELDED